MRGEREPGSVEKSRNTFSLAVVSVASYFVRLLWGTTVPQDIIIGVTTPDKHLDDYQRLVLEA